jgi:cytochrome c peroxidase
VKRVAGLLVVALLACGPSQGTPWDWKLPKDMPAPAVPADNPVTVEKVALGRHLFYDVRLSGNGTQACATCHSQAKAFSDGNATPRGSTGEDVPRNAPGLANVAYLYPLTWANPQIDTLEKQALGPMFGEAPIELGVGADPEKVYQRFRDDPAYQKLFAAAFPGEKDPVRTELITKAIASFERTLVSFQSPYDQFRQGVKGALSASAMRGHAFFFEEKGECYHCHFGPELSSAYATADTRTRVIDFHNTGLYDVDGKGGYPAPNRGLFELTQKPGDMGFFRVPSLRNVALTAPYMHDGSMATLSDVLDFYAAGGREIPAGPHAGDGRANPHKDPLVRKFPLTAEEKADLLAFLESLTDTTLVTDERFSNPFPVR